MKIRTLATPRTVTIAVLTLLIVGHLFVLSNHIWRSEKFRMHYAPRAGTVLNYCYAVSAFAIIPAGWLMMRLRQTRRSFFEEVRSWLPVRAALYFMFLALVLTSVALAFHLIPYQKFIVRSFFQSSVLLCLDLWVLLILYYRPLSAEGLTWPWRCLDVTLLNLVATLVLAEGTLALWANYSPGRLPLGASNAKYNLAMLRQEPNRPYFNFRLNSRGYHDTEFFNATERDFVVAVLADSFGFGVVPYAYNFSTLTEIHLQEALRDQYERVAVHNLGITGISMPEYAFLLEDEVLETNPAYVVLCVFVGNDFRGTPQRMPYLFQQWRLWVLMNGAIAVWNEHRSGAGVLKIGEPGQPNGSVPEYVRNSQKEPPTFSEETFLKIETKRLEVSNPRNPSRQEDYRRFFNYLEDFHARLGIKLIVVVIPDEFQVNDELYQQILSTKQNPNDYQREYPQERLRTYCEEHGIAMLDLLPVLREANTEERVYHLRDTHWNARGNRVAAREIADIILSHHRSRSIIDR